MLIENITLNKEYAVIKVSKPGFFDGFKTITPSNNGLTTVTIQLVKKPTAVTFNSQTAATVKPAVGVSIEFPSQAIRKSNNESYTGTVNVVAKYYDPKSEDFTLTYPGTLAGMDNDNKLKPLQTYGMVNIELTDDAGNELNLKTGSKAKITLPAPVGSPATIPLWHFNETYGLWVQVGTAEKIGNQYVGEVSHFSSYNLDIKSESPATINLTFTDGVQPLEGQRVDLYINGQASISANTDNKGEITYLLADATATYSVKLPFDCNATFEKTLTQITTGENNQTIAVTGITALKSFTISGKLETCLSGDYGNKAFSLTIDFGTKKGIYGGFTDEVGNFSITRKECSGIIKPNTSYPATLNIYDGGEQKTVIEPTLISDDQGNLLIKINPCSGITTTYDDNDIIIFENLSFKNAILEKYYPGKTEITYGMAKELTEMVLFNTIEGEINEVGYFVNLTSLSFKYGSRITKIPASLGNLSQLQDLYLSNNQLSGEIPASLGNLSQLRVLDLFANQLSGEIPASLGNLSQLRDLWLNNNQLSGEIPASFGNLSQLQGLGLNNNQLSGEIPASLGNLSQLQDLYLNYNQLSGGIPASLGNLSQLQSLGLNNNQLSGEIPASLGNLSQLRDLWLNNNQLSGEIPASFGNLSQLQNLSLDNNQELSGSLKNVGLCKSTVHVYSYNTKIINDCY